MKVSRRKVEKEKNIVLHCTNYRVILNLFQDLKLYGNMGDAETLVLSAVEVLVLSAVEVNSVCAIFTHTALDGKVYQTRPPNTHKRHLHLQCLRTARHA